MIFPSIIEDETLYSLVSRIAILNGMTPSAMQNEIGTIQSYRAADINLDFAKFSNFTNGYYGNDSEFVTRFRRRSLLENNDISLIGISNENRNIWRWCPECRSEELKNNGVAVWHLKHQDFLAKVCTSHKSALFEINIPFRERQNLFYLPFENESKFKFFKINVDVDKAIAIEVINESLIQKVIDWDEQILRWIFNERSKNHSYHHNLLEICRICSIKEADLNNEIKMEFADPKFLSRYLSVLIYIYFGRYDMFYKYYLWIESLYPQIIEYIHPKKVCNFRELLIEFKIKNPNANRTDFWKKHPKAARWLHKYDIKWLDENFPLNVNRSPIQLLMKFN